VLTATSIKRALCSALTRPCSGTGICLLGRQYSNLTPCRHSKAPHNATHCGVACCHFSAAGTFEPLTKACQALAAELQSALQQQQQQQPPASSLKGGFLSAGQRGQQSEKPAKQQRRLSDSILQGLTLGRVLITLWQALVQAPAGSSYHNTLFSNADQRASVLPASQLMMVLLRAQERQTTPTNSVPGSSNNSSSSSGGGGAGSRSSSSATDWSWMVGQDEPV
jgi:hypothetical protein